MELHPPSPRDGTSRAGSPVSVPTSPWMSLSVSSPLFLTPSEQESNSSLTTQKLLSATPEANSSTLFIDSDISEGDTEKDSNTPDINYLSLGNSPFIDSLSPITPVSSLGLSTTEQRYPQLYSTPLTNVPGINVSETSESEEPLPMAKRRRLFTSTQTTYQLEEFSHQISAEEASFLTSDSKLTPKCCSKECLQNLQSEEISKVRFTFHCRKQNEQSQFLLDAFQLTNSETVHLIAGQQVCANAFIHALGISRKRYRKLYRKYSSGSFKSLRKPPVRCMMEKTSDATAWMSNYFEKIADRMPHTGQLHLPHFLTERDIYLIMRREMLEQDREIISIQHFYGIWNKMFKHVTIPEHSLFSKCDICVKYSEERSKLGSNKMATEELQGKYQKHLDFIKQERATYYRHRHKARSEPHKYMTMIVDGMDQSKTNVPYLCRKTKSTQNLWRLQTHITGVLIHTGSSRGKRPLAFIDLHQYPHDSNLTLNILLEVLKLAHPLPPVLYLQLDNCFRENKNKFLLGFCALLVQVGIFRKVRVNFLPVGHTHEDVDQFFSRIAESLRKHGAETLAGLEDVVKASYTPCPGVVWVEKVYDIKAWLTPHLEELHGHTQPHCYRFTVDSENHALMHYKQWSDRSWMPDAGIKLLKGTPDSPLELCNPSFEKQDTARLQEDLSKWKLWLNTDSQEEWDKFFKETLPLLLAMGEQEHSCPWQSMILTAQNRPISSPSHNSLELNRELTDMFEAENAQPQVYTGPYRKPGSTTSRVISECDLSALEVGQMVAVQSEDSSDKPLIGRCTKILEDEIEVAWLDGSYTTTWWPSKKPDPKNSRKTIDWTDYPEVLYHTVRFYSNIH